MDARNALVDSIVIAGGGTAGWMVAASLAKALRGRVAIRLVESEEIGSVGVGEATIPMIQLYNRSLEIDEDAFVRATQASFKLGIEFVDWGRVGGRYIHGFGRFGQDLGTVPFDQYWQKMHQAGRAADLGDYGIARSAARAGKFIRPTSESSPIHRWPTSPTPSTSTPRCTPASCAGWLNRGACNGWKAASRACRPPAPTASPRCTWPTGAASKARCSSTARASAAC